MCRECADPARNDCTATGNLDGGAGRNCDDGAMSEQPTEIVDPDAVTTFDEDDDPETLIGEEVDD